MTEDEYKKLTELICKLHEITDRIDRARCFPDSSTEYRRGWNDALDFLDGKWGGDWDAADGD